MIDTQLRRETIEEIQRSAARLEIALPGFVPIDGLLREAEHASFYFPHGDDQRVDYSWTDFEYVPVEGGTAWGVWQLQWADQLLRWQGYVTGFAETVAELQAAVARFVSEGFVPFNRKKTNAGKFADRSRWRPGRLDTEKLGAAFETAPTFSEADLDSLSAAHSYGPSYLLISDDLELTIPHGAHSHTITVEENLERVLTEITGWVPWGITPRAYWDEVVIPPFISACVPVRDKMQKLAALAHDALSIIGGKSLFQPGSQTARRGR